MAIVIIWIWFGLAMISLISYREVLEKLKWYKFIAAASLLTIGAPFFVVNNIIILLLNLIMPEG